jgi:pyruvate/2-oxoglutarate/acetoin dehydrogenase E1 component
VVFYGEDVADYGGAVMKGMRSVAELMLFDFALMSSNQISNQAAKWYNS